MKLKMELGCFYDHIKAAVKEKGITLAEALAIARAHGITALDVNSDELKQIPPEEFREMVQGYGMRVASVHGFFPCGVGTAEEYADSLDRMKQVMGMAKCAGSQFFMPVPQKTEDGSASENPLEQDSFVKGIRRLFSDLVAYGGEIGLTVIVENFSLPEYPYTSYEDIDYLMTHNPDMRYAYDIGNYALAGLDELEGARLFMERVVYVHLKDIKETEESPYTLFRNGKHYDSLEIGGGFLRIREALNLLAENDYEGALIIEINSGPDCFDRAMQSARYLEGLFADMAH